MGRVFEWLLPQPVDDCLRVLSSCLLGGKHVTPLMCSTTETVGNASGDGEEDTVRSSRDQLTCDPEFDTGIVFAARVLASRNGLWWFEQCPKAHFTVFYASLHLSSGMSGEPNRATRQRSV